MLQQLTTLSYVPAFSTSGIFRNISLMTLCVVTDCSSSIHPGRIIIDIMTQENFSKSSEIVSPLLNYN